MVILAEISPEFKGKIYVNEPIEVRTLNKTPVAVFEVKLNVSIDLGRNQDQPNQAFYDVGYRMEETHCALMFQQIPLSHSFFSPGSIDPRMTATLDYLLRISTGELKEIELKRVDDIILYLHLEGTIVPYRWNSAQNLGPPKRFSLAVPWKFSQRQWIQFLRDIGYSEKWIIEIERPKLEGFHEVSEHLDKAQEALFNKNDPEDVLRDLRSARDSFAAFFNAKKEDILKLIDQGSQGEEGQPTKSERVQSMFEDITKFLQIGPHNNRYKVTFADAQLAFRSFVTLLSFLSPFLSKVEEKKKGE